MIAILNFISKLNYVRKLLSSERLFYISIFLLCVSFSSKGFSQVKDTRLKVAYVYKLQDYFTWNDESQFSDFHIVQLGDDKELNLELIKLSELTVKNDKKIRISQVNTLRDLNLNEIRILLVTNKETSNLKEILASIKGTSTLLISDNASTNDHVMVNLVLEGQELKLNSNWSNMANQKFKVDREVLILSGSREDLEKYNNDLQKELDLEKEKAIQREQTIREQHKKIEAQLAQLKTHEKKISDQNAEIADREKRILAQGDRLDSQKDMINSAKDELGQLQLELQKEIQLYEDQVRQSQSQQEEIKEAEDKISAHNSTISGQMKEIEEQRKHLGSQEKQISSQRTMLVFSISLFLLISILLVIIYYYYKVKKAANTQLREKNELLNLQQIQIVEQAETIQHNAEQHEQFLASTSHELRTPMNAIAGFIDLINKASSEKKKQEYLGYIKQSAKNVLNISNDILDITKIESGQIMIEKIPFKVKNIVNTAVNSLKFNAKNKGLKLRITWVSDNDLIVIGDPTRLNQILINLISNALKFTSEGSVEIIVNHEDSSTLSQHTNLNIKVKDTGIGIPADKLDVIFEKYTQSGADIKRKYGGTGLGLSISRQLVELQGGSIKVESTLNEGSTFQFSIPYPIADEETNIVKAGNVDFSAYPWIETMNILVVDDNHINRIMAIEKLQSISPKINVLTSQNGKEAIDILESEKFDIVYLDLNMPVMDGIETAEYIRTKLNNQNKDIYIAGFTAQINEDDLQKWKSKGINSSISKPFIDSELILSLAESKGIEIDSSQIAYTAPAETIEAYDTSAFMRFIQEKFSSEEDRTEVANILLEEIPEELVNISQYLNEEDWEKVIESAHRMNNKAVYTGHNDFKIITQKIEIIARSDKNYKEIKLLVKKEKEVWETVKQEILAYLQNVA